jgi:hypothetical protein
MGIDINQYRANIGSFNNNIYKDYSRNKEIQPSKSQPKYKLYYVLLISIIIGSLAAIYQCDEYHYYNITEPSLQSNNLCGQVSMDIQISFILQYSMNVLASYYDLKLSVKMSIWQ